MTLLATLGVILLAALGFFAGYLVGATVGVKDTLRHMHEKGIIIKNPNYRARERGH